MLIGFGAFENRSHEKIGKRLVPAVRQRDDGVKQAERKSPPHDPLDPPSSHVCDDLAVQRLVER